MLYECYPVDADYVVVSPKWWGFAGTGVTYGTAIPGLVGGESDRVYPDRARRDPCSCSATRRSPAAGVTTTSQSVYYTVPSGRRRLHRRHAALGLRAGRPLRPATRAPGPATSPAG